ncbi:sarcosine oxidase subunit delta [Steroidobacter sp.]|uniref:sarcosine oxidase subunit delta n=1 Tax=Steroidobacter sp. TaxID=1978227 RepID=UPI001A5CD36E|nr:sarcosine oxidase subunit delta [Steroidobacter sp.]MBL8268935.1 sarcosine oxidase subunit delta [Steroidobacter sp.]
MLIDCPFCGPRESYEFQFLRVLAPSGADAFNEVYGRVNRLDVSMEHWQHRHGCQAWLIIERNPSTAQVLSVTLLRGDRS